MPKWCTLFEIIFWNNFAGLNMCCAPLNAAHFEGQWVWLSFNINFFKGWNTPGPSKCAPLFVSYMMHTGAGVLLYYGEVFSHKVYILWTCLQVNYLGGVINTAKSASGVSLTLRSQAQRCHCHHEVRLCDVYHWHWWVKLCSVIVTADFYVIILQSQYSFLSCPLVAFKGIVSQ